MPSTIFLFRSRACARQVGMVSLGHVALGVTKVQANPFTHKAMSNERILRAEMELHRQEDVGFLLPEQPKNVFWLCRASAWIS